MKQIFKYILIGLSLLSVSAVASSQSVHREGGVATTKTVSAQDSNGNYTIKLETWAEGETTVVETATPVDVVLVLDVSGSMDFPKGEVTAERKNFSYNDIANSEYTYFYESDGSYWKVYPRVQNGYYDLAYYPGSLTHIGNYSNYASNPNSGLGTRTLYRGTETRMDALKKAVNSFIEDIERDDHQDKNGNEREERLGNRISIVKFAGNSTNTVGNSTYYSNNSGTTNYSQIVMNLTNVAGNVDAIKAEVNAFQSMGGTQAGYGMNHANTVLANADPTHTKVVVFFTDGDPDDDRAAIGNANNGGTNAYRAKNTLGAVVYTIGMFTSSPATNGNTWRYLNYISSNYPKATVNNGTMTSGTGSDQGYYQDASGDVDLSAIFKSISAGIGGSETTVAASTQIRDVVSSSFTIPAGFNANNVVIYSVRAKKQATLAWDEDTRQDYTPAADQTDAVSAVIDEQNGHKRLVVTGFDFSKADTPEGSNSGNGNWVGERYTQADGRFYAGAKLVIEFKIREVEGATGGAGTNTNTSDSGVYIFNPQTNEYENVNHYVIPHTTLPINIVIKKTGLRTGESATFEVEYCRPKNWDESKTLAENIAAMEYNDIGKPIPDGNWKNFSKVILTNKGADKAEVTKTMLALDPYYIYRVNEDKWSWAYTLSGNTGTTSEIPNTSTVEVNPFRFTNTEKTDVVKHAEAVTINHFGYTIKTGEFAGQQEEHYKSSKVEKL